jgi:hypothetical protein
MRSSLVFACYEQIHGNTRQRNPAGQHMLTSEGKQKKPKMRSNLVFACYEQIHGKTRQRYPKDRARASNESGVTFSSCNEQLFSPNFTTNEQSRDMFL